MNHRPVRMFTLSTCSHCKAVKRFLDKCTVQYDATDVDRLTGRERAAVLEELRGLNPKCSVPTITIGDEVIIGFDEEAIRKALDLP